MKNSEQKDECLTSSGNIANAMLPAAFPVSTEEGNAIISKFMGKKFKDPLNYMYDKSWDWLMSVVEKIENTTVKGTTWTSIDDKAKVEWQFSVEIINVQCMIHRDCLPQYYGTNEDFLKLYDCRNMSKIQATWLAVIEFINWYNKPVSKR